MPTQEELNAAQVELDIANDNYAQLADRYNKYQQLFQTYASSSPEIQNRAAAAMWRALEDYYQTQEKMKAAEERIAQAQNVMNNYNEIIANQPVVQPAKRRIITTQTPNWEIITQEVPNTIANNTVNDWVVTVQNGGLVDMLGNPISSDAVALWTNSNWKTIYVNPNNVTYTDAWPIVKSNINPKLNNAIIWYTADWKPIKVQQGGTSTVVSSWTPEVAWTWQSGTQSWWRTPGQLQFPSRYKGWTPTLWSWTTTNTTTTTNNSFWWAGWTYNADGSMTSPNWQTKVYADWSISFWPSSTTSTPRRRINITPSANPIDRIKWTYNMGVWANNTLYNVAKARVGYNNLTDWNWIGWIRDNLQWWVNMVKGAAWAIKWAAQFNKWLNQFQWNFN